MVSLNVALLFGVITFLLGVVITLKPSDAKGVEGAEEEEIDE